MPIDTHSISNANVFGELLRQFAFKEETGCYSCFDLEDGFVKVSPDSESGVAILTALELTSDDLTENLTYATTPREQAEISARFYEDLDKAVANLWSNGTVHLGWVWDGDGTLVVIEGGRAAINTDCKKDYTWEWVVTD